MMKALSNRVCSVITVRTRALFTKFCVAWRIVPPPPILIALIRHPWVGFVQTWFNGFKVKLNCNSMIYFLRASGQCFSCLVPTIQYTVALSQGYKGDLSVSLCNVLYTRSPRVLKYDFRDPGGVPMTLRLTLGVPPEP